jgi:hypothetical protein
MKFIFSNNDWVLVSQLARHGVKSVRLSSENTFKLNVLYTLQKTL